jgi:hypothetical protein
MLSGWPPTLSRRPCFRSSPASTWNSNTPNRKIRSELLDSRLRTPIDILLEVDSIPFVRLTTGSKRRIFNRMQYHPHVACVPLRSFARIPEAICGRKKG